MYLCGFVALSVRMCDTGANKDEGTVSWCLGTNEILASKHHSEVKQGHFETAVLILHNFFVFNYGYSCLEALHLHIFMIQTLCSVMQLFKSSYFSVGAASRHFWPNSAIANGTKHVQDKEKWIYSTRIDSAVRSGSRFHKCTAIRNSARKRLHWSIQNSSCTLNVPMFFGQYEKRLLNFVSERIKLVYRINNTRLAFQTFKTKILQATNLRIKVHV